MNISDCYKTLQIEPTKDVQKIKKAYRKLAFQYHPDRNKSESSNEMFIQLTEAYQTLMQAIELEKQPQHQSRRRQKTKQQQYNRRHQQATGETESSSYQKQREFEKRLFWARKMYEYQKQKEAVEEELYYRELTQGKKWNFFKIIAFSSAFFAAILFVDYFLPTHTTEHFIEKYSPRKENQGLHSGTVTPVRLDNNENIWIPKNFLTSTYNKPIYVERTFLFNDIKKIKSWQHTQWVTVVPDYSIMSVFPLVHFLLLLPLIGYFIKGKTMLFIMIHHISSYVFPFLLTYLLISNFRIISLLSMGFVHI